ncbi:MAG: hypothetical protein JWM67_1198, partial [Mycobacterium sp.]|nr:hypothetical protein [Mycobacterium sp.]
MAVTDFRQAPAPSGEFDRTPP